MEPQYGEIIKSLEKHIAQLEHELKVRDNRIGVLKNELIEAELNVKREKAIRCEVIDLIHRIQLTFDPELRQYTIAVRITDALFAQTKGLTDDHFHYLAEHLARSLERAFRAMDFSMVRESHRRANIKFVENNWQTILEVPHS